MLGLGFIAGAVRLYRRADRRAALQLYLFSLAYLALLFCAMVADAHLSTCRIFAAMMTRRLARKNIRTGLIVAAICMFMFGLTFVVAAVYVS